MHAPRRHAGNDSLSGIPRRLTINGVMLRPLLLAVVLLGASSAAALAQDSPQDTTTCPASLFQFHGAQTVMAGTYGSMSVPGGGGAGFNCTDGSLWSTCGVHGDFTLPGDAALRVTDRMHVLGVTAGTPLTFKAALHLTGYYAGAEAKLWSWIVEGERNANAFQGIVRSSGVDHMVDTTLRIVIHRAAGEWFDLATMAWTYSDPGWASVQGTLTFEGLPSGARVTSCRGYIAATSVPRPDGATRLALGVPWPNPTHGAVHARVMLPDQRPATLVLVDIAGRALERRIVVGAGEHFVTLARPPGPGLYLIRLARDREAVTRSFVAR